MILTTFAVLTTLAWGDPDPLAPARAGQVQCYEPDAGARTCQSISSYRFGPDGRITNKAEVVVNDEVRLVMVAEGEVYIRDNAECSADPVSPEQILSIEIDGEPVLGNDLDELREAFAAGINDEVGEGEYCSTYHPKSDGSMVALVTVAGASRPDLTSTVRWVRREDGWRLQP